MKGSKGSDGNHLVQKSSCAQCPLLFKLRNFSIRQKVQSTHSFNLSFHIFFASLKQIDANLHTEAKHFLATEFGKYLISHEL